MRIFLLVIFVLKVGLLWATTLTITIDLESISVDAPSFQRVPFLPSKLGFADSKRRIGIITNDFLSAYCKEYFNVPYIMYLTCEDLAAESRQSPAVFGQVSAYLNTETTVNDQAVYQAFLKMYPYIQVTKITPETIFSTRNSCREFVNLVATNFLPKLLHVMGADTSAIDTVASVMIARSKVPSMLFDSYRSVLTLFRDEQTRYSLSGGCAITIGLENIPADSPLLQHVPFLPSKLDFFNMKKTEGILCGDCFSATFKGYFNIPYITYLTCKGLAAESRQSPEIFRQASVFLNTTTTVNDEAVYQAFLKMHPYIQVTGATIETIFASESSCREFVNLIATNFLPKLLHVMGADTTITDTAVSAISTSHPRILNMLFNIHEVVLQYITPRRRCSIFKYCCFLG